MKNLTIAGLAFMTILTVGQVIRSWDTLSSTETNHIETVVRQWQQEDYQ